MTEQELSKRWKNRPKGKLRKGWMYYHGPLGWQVIPRPPRIKPGKLRDWVIAKRAEDDLRERRRAAGAIGGAASKGRESARIRAQKAAKARWANHVWAWEQVKGAKS